MTNPCLESSPTPSRLPKPCMRKTSFSKKNLVVFENTLLNVSVKIWDYPPRRMCWRTSRTVMVLIQSDLLDCLPTPFSENSSCEIPFATMFVFQKIHVMHSHLIPRLPRAYKIHYAISTEFISYRQIYHHAYIYIIKVHKTCCAH